MAWKCFLIEPMNTARRSLRRYCFASEGGLCPGRPGSGSGHDAIVHIESVPVVISDDGEWKWDEEAFTLDRADLRFPTKCDHCDYMFTDKDQYVTMVRRWYRDMQSEDETLYVLGELPVGAMYYADWEAHWGWKGPDGKILCVQTPGGLWVIDSRANNCTLPDDNEHRCWVRHGTPPNIHVDKNGVTCAAGAGSIMMGGYHGFLHNGYITDPI